jgi:hypothetical protein
MLENDPRSDQYTDELSHHHANRSGDLAAAWSVALLIALIAAFAFGLDHLAAIGSDSAAISSDSKGPAVRSAGAGWRPLAEEIGLVPRGRPE